MTTELHTPLKREIEIDGERYTVLLTPQGIRLSKKRFREGHIISWRDILARTASDEDGVGP